MKVTEFSKEHRENLNPKGIPSHIASKYKITKDSLKNPEVKDAFEYLEEHWEKGNKNRGHALVLLALGIMQGRSEQQEIDRRNPNG